MEWKNVWWKKDEYYTTEIKEGKGLLKEYDFFGEKIFEGHFVNGERNGHGKEYKFNSVIFEGEYKNGKRHGKGKEFINGTEIFNGEYNEGKKWEGIGFDQNNKIICKFNNGRGFIKEYKWCNYTISFEGEFNNEDGSGKVKEYNICGILIYEGKYLNGKRNGKGKEYNYYDGKLEFVGEYLNGKRLKGKLYNEGKIEFIGFFLRGRKWHGKGYDYKGNVI